jgi:hypothetical protein
VEKAWSLAAKIKAPVPFHKRRMNKRHPSIYLVTPFGLKTPHPFLLIGEAKPSPRLPETVPAILQFTQVTIFNKFRSEKGV